MTYNQVYRRKRFLKGSLKRHTFYSETLSNRRRIDVYLPPSYYRKMDKYYPVLYMHDGNNLFDPNISFAGVHWRVDSTIDYLVNKKLMNEVIVVGIHNNIQREYEYTWTPMEFPMRGMQGGGGSEYAEFIISELKPFIDRHYRTLSDRENTAVMGSSLGGLISFYLGLYHSDTFSKIGVISPSFWWGYGEAFNDVRMISDDLKIWIDMGENEDFVEEDNEDDEEDPDDVEVEIDTDIDEYDTDKVSFNIAGVRLMRDLLTILGYQEGHNLGYLEAENGMHNEESWANRLHLPLLFFFGK